MILIYQPAGGSQFYYIILPYNNKNKQEIIGKALLLFVSAFSDRNVASMDFNKFRNKLLLPSFKKTR